MGLPAGADSVQVIKRIQTAAQIVQAMMLDAQRLTAEQAAA